MGPCDSLLHPDGTRCGQPTLTYVGVTAGGHPQCWLCVRDGLRRIQVPR